jgi:hypothetical protein
MTLAIDVILNPSSVILSEAKDLFLFRVNSVKDLSQNDPLFSKLLALTKRVT